MLAPEFYSVAVLQVNISEQAMKVLRYEIGNCFVAFLFAKITLTKDASFAFRRSSFVKNGGLNAR